ncbi:MAG: c-type cytochrome biogenesis protein CcmI [Methylobacteriaceae bacterium]|nr:c-type cytochrome biogenesis protein CcmI [Methylobacteriaceae bacterium]
MIWALFAALTVAALALALRPLLGAAGGGAAARTDADFYREQLAEIDRDLGRGLLTPEDAEAARVEAARRLLAVAPGAAGPTAAPARAARRLSALAIAVLVPLLAVGVYLKLGRPDQPDLPLAARKSDDPAKLDLVAAVAKVEDHLRRNPNDGRGFEALAPVYMRMQRYRDAARAFSEAARLLGETPDRLVGLAEADIFMANGVVTAQTRRTLERALAADATYAGALYYLGLAAEQDGDTAKAVSLYERILGSAAPDDPSYAGVRRRIAQLKGGDAAAAIAALPKDDQQQAIRAMVEGLAARLSENGQDREGWLRLVRAWSVLGERDKAKTALADARKALAADAAAIGALDALARELGLEG